MNQNHVGIAFKKIMTILQVKAGLSSQSWIKKTERLRTRRTQLTEAERDTHRERNRDRQRRKRDCRDGEAKKRKEKRKEKKVDDVTEPSGR